MTKADIIQRIHERIRVPKKEAAELVESVLEIIKHTLELGEDVKVSGFGKFEVKQKADRKGRNPQTGEALTICARRVLTFRPSAILRAEVNAE